MSILSSGPDMQADIKGPSVAIIGAGIGGLSFAIALKRQFGFENFTIYEQGPDVGGTWRDNIYPGCGSDVSVHFYSLSTDLNPMWDTRLASQPEIQSYWKRLTEKYHLRSHLVFNSLVTSAEWSVTEQIYSIQIRDVHTGVTTSTKAQVLISATGALSAPRSPNLPGISTFKGKSFHSAGWNHGINLCGKRVAVIGNGASASQFIPIISEDPSVQVTNFCRTPYWFISAPRSPYSSTTKWLFSHVPFIMRLYRNFLYVRSESSYAIFYSEWLSSIAMENSKKYILATAPSEYHDKLIPNYPMGCKRILIDSNYLHSLHRPNVNLIWDDISAITENGIKTVKGGDIPFDVVIYATGFKVDEYPLSIRGINGQTIQDYFKSKAGPQAYMGTNVPGFPNFYMILGPNTGTGHTSAIFTEEVQINYSLQLLKPVLDGFVSSFEVTAEATDAYNDKLHARLARSVFAHCTSWYRVGGKGKVSAIFPWPTALLWWWSRRPIWDHYKVVGAERWLGSRRLMRISRILGGLLLLSAPFLWAVPMQLRKARSWPPLTGSMGLSRMIASLVRT